MSENLARFKDALPRYFEGDLDAVEMRWFERVRDEDELCARHFSTRYDARSAEQGLLSLSPGDADVSECFSFDTMSQYVDGELDEIDQNLVRAHLACPLCAPQVEALQAEARPVAVVAESTSPGWQAWFEAQKRWLVGIAVVGAAAALSIVVNQTEPTDPLGHRPEFVARGSDDQSLEKLVGADFSIGTKTLADGARIKKNARLEVSYRNARSEKPVYFMAFGIDATGEVRWYYPAWTDPQANPTSILLPPSKGKRLDDAVAHDLPTGSYRLVTWFTDSPHAVRDVENRVVAWFDKRALGGPPTELNLGKGHRADLEVVVIP
jgi:hypothetical protein